VASFTLVPIAVGIAILRYRLYDIDIIINRTLVYGALTAGVVALYVLIVGTLGALFQARGDLAVSLVAAGVVAVVFAPLRERLQRSVNRLMYGERDDPYAVLSRLGQRLEATIAPEAALKTIVETIAQALKVPYVAIDLSQDGKVEFVTVIEHGSPKEELVVLPLVYQRETIGRLIVASRAPGEAFSPTDMHLLEDLVRQVEVAVHAVRLTADLQRSRERLVTTREEERRRLRRDLHDGLGPTLGALTLGLDTTRLALAQDDPKAVDGLLLELKAQTHEAVSDVRRLVYGLRPPALDDLGLVPAIRQQAANHGLLAEELPNGKAAGGRTARMGSSFRWKPRMICPHFPQQSRWLATA
jgi:signal transduction histidine kinase